MSSVGAILMTKRFGVNVSALESMRAKNGNADRSRLFCTASREMRPDPINEETSMSVVKTIRPYHKPAGGWDALKAVAGASAEQHAVFSTSDALLQMNQPEGYDYPGWAWPEPKHTSSFEFCENGDKAVAWTVRGLKIVPYAFPDGCCAAYYLETSPLVPLYLRDPHSFTPSSKSIPVRLVRSGSNGRTGVMPREAERV
jgi:hypothetical protein